MSDASPRRLRTPPGSPTVYLVDARPGGLGEAALRERAGELTTACGLAHSSRSYRDPLGLVAVHRGRVGIDIERVQPLDDEFLASISSMSERAHTVEAADRDRYAASLWSSKEALAKALGDAVEYDPRRLDSPMFWPEGRSGPWRALALDLPDGYVGWLCWRAEAAEP